MTARLADDTVRWRLASVSVTDFRGILGSQVYKLDGHPTLIWGGNGVGKSTVALALEWTLFGAFPSNALGAPKDPFMSPVGGNARACKGEVVFTRGNNRLVIRRDANTKTFTVELGGKKMEDDDARVFLEDQLELDMDTFVRAVLLQQSKVRGLLLDDVKDRNKALDRLLGMNAAEAMLETVKPKTFKDAAQAWRDNVDATEARFQSQGELLEKRFNETQKEARAHKFLGKDLSGAGLRSLYSALERDLAEMAAKYGARAPSELPAADSVAAAKKTSAALAKVINQIRLGAELQQKLGSIDKKLGKVQEASRRWAEVTQARARAQETLDGMIKRHGDAKAIAARRNDIEQEINRITEQLRSRGELRSLLMQARGYFARDNVKSCPVCEQGVAQPKAVLRSIGDRIDALTTKDIRDIEKTLDKANKSHTDICDAEKKLQSMQTDLVGAQEDVDAGRKAVMKALGIDGLVETKVGAALDKAIKDLEEQRIELSKGVETLEKDLEVFGERDRAIRDGLLPFLEAREAVDSHEREWKKAKQSYAEVEKKAGAMDNVATQLERIRKAILTAKDEIASTTLGKAAPRAQEMYEKLVQHPLFDRLDVKTALKANKVDYSFEVSSSTVGKSGREARLVLSDGQMTAAALALFYSLAESGHHGLDLLYVDDPTQNLDHTRKEAMAKVVADLATRKQIVVSTQDEDFVVLLRDAGFEDVSVVHHLEQWDRRPTVKTVMPKTKNAQSERQE